MLLIELTLAALVLVEITRAVLAVRAGKRDDVDWPTALEHGLSAVMPRRVVAMAARAAAVAGAATGVSRRTDVSGQETAIPYAGPLLPVLVAVLVVDGIGIVVLHLLLPWPAVRLAMLVVGVLGLVWLAGFLAGLRVYPHAVGPDRLRIRFGALREYRIRPADVTAVYSQQRSWDISGMTAVLDGDLVPVIERDDGGRGAGARHQRRHVPPGRDGRRATRVLRGGRPCGGRPCHCRVDAQRP